MSAAKHTPGPWVHHALDNIITTPNGFCQLLEWQARSLHVSQEERDANARLIAAAPELLEALQFVMTAHGEQLDLAFQRAQEAIAKATGGEA